MKLSGRAIWCAYAILVALAIVPILTTDLPPLFDYPNHLARMHLLAEGGDQFYAVAWSALPNLAEDLIVPPLTALLPLPLAGKLFLILTLALLSSGPILLGRMVWGEWSGWSLGGCLMLYSRTLLWGFLNYLFGLGVAFCGIAAWLALTKTAWWIRVAVGSTIATVVYFCHIEAFGCYALMIVGFEAMTARRSGSWSRLWVSLAQFVIPLGLFLNARLATGGGQLRYADFGRKADLLFGVFDNYHRPFDVVCFAALGVLFVALLAMRRLKGDSGGMAALGLLFGAYLLLPSQLFSGSGADHRLPVALFLMLFAVTRPVVSKRLTTMIGLSVLGLFLVRMSLIERVWIAADETYRADLALLDRLLPGASLAVAYPVDAVNMVPVPETHMPTLAIIRREAFVPTLFAYAAQQPIALKPPYAARAALASPNVIWSAFDGSNIPDRARTLKILGDFDYAVFLGRHVDMIVPDACLRLVGATGTFRLYQVQRAACDGSYSN